jgi:hypothetical protein
MLKKMRLNVCIKNLLLHSSIFETIIEKRTTQITYIDVL